MLVVSGDANKDFLKKCYRVVAWMQFSVTICNYGVFTNYYTRSAAAVSHNTRVDIESVP